MNKRKADVYVALGEAAIERRKHIDAEVAQALACDRRAVVRALAKLMKKERPPAPQARQFQREHDAGYQSGWWAFAEQAIDLIKSRSKKSEVRE